MTEQNVEGAPEVDPQATGQPSGATPSQEASTIETLQARLDEMETRYRKMQGKMDKDAHAIEQRLTSSFEERLGKLGVNLSPEQKLQNEILDIREQLASVGERPAKAEPQTIKEPQKPVNIAEIKRAYSDIDFNDPKVLETVSQNLDSEDKLLAALGRIKVSNVAKPKPTAASTVSPSGGATSSVATIEELQAEFDRLATPANWKSGKDRRAEIVRLMQEIDNSAQ